MKIGHTGDVIIGDTRRKVGMFLFLFLLLDILSGHLRG